MYYIELPWCDFRLNLFLVERFSFTYSRLKNNFIHFYFAYLLSLIWGIQGTQELPFFHPRICEYVKYLPRIREIDPLRYPRNGLICSEKTRNGVYFSVNPWIKSIPSSSNLNIFYHTHTHTQIHQHTHTHTHEHTPHTHRDTHTHTHTHTRTHTPYTHTYTNTLKCGHFGAF